MNLFDFQNVNANGEDDDDNPGIQPIDEHELLKSDDQDLSNTLGAISGALSLIGRQLANNSAELKEVRRERQSDRREIKGVKQELDDFKQDVHDEIGDIKSSQYVDQWQAANIQEAAKTRVADLFNNWCRDNNADSDIIFAKYYGKFVRQVHNDAKIAKLEIGKIIYTPKKNYTKLLEFIGTWYPKRGIEGQMKHYDDLQKYKNS